MRVPEIRNQVALMLLSVGVVAIPCRTVAQEPPDELTPRAIADSTYAVSVTVNALVADIRRGQLDPRQFDEPQLAAIVGRLATAGARRTRRPPQAALEPLWDFTIDLVSFQPEGRDVLRAQAKVYLATTSDSVRTPVTLIFARHADHWVLRAHEGLVPRLMALATAVERGSGGGGRR